MEDTAKISSEVENTTSDQQIPSNSKNVASPYVKTITLQDFITNLSSTIEELKKDVAQNKKLHEEQKQSVAHPSLYYPQGQMGGQHFFPQASGFPQGQPFVFPQGNNSNHVQFPYTHTSNVGSCTETTSLLSSDAASTISGLKMNKKRKNKDKTDTKMRKKAGHSSELSLNKRLMKR